MPPLFTRRRWMAHLGPLLLLGAPWPEGRAQARAPGELLIGGTGTGLAPLPGLLDGRAHVRSVPSLGSSGGIKAVAAGAIDVAVSSRRLTPAEAATGLVERALFHTPMLWAVHGEVPLAQATQADLVRWYAQQQANWPGGTPLRLVLRPESDGDTRFLKDVSAAMAEAVAQAQARPGVMVATTDLDAVESIERIAGALGFTNLAMLRNPQRRVKALAVDGVAPTLDNLAAGRWRHAKSVWLVTRASAPPATQELVAHLGSPRSAKAMPALGCLPLAT